MPPFVHAMGESLKQSGYRTRRIPGTDWMHKAEDAKYRGDIALLHQVADDVSGCHPGPGLRLHSEYSFPLSLTVDCQEEVWRREGVYRGSAG